MTTQLYSSGVALDMSAGAFGELEDFPRLLGSQFPWRQRFELLDKDMDWKPTADIIEREDEYLIKAELPEVKREDVDITLENGILTLKGERRLEESKEEDTQHRVESFYGSFSRSFRVPEDVDTAGIHAESKDGVLRLHLPKAKVQKPETVKIAIR